MRAAAPRALIVILALTVLLGCWLVTSSATKKVHVPSPRTMRVSLGRLATYELETTKPTKTACPGYPNKGHNPKGNPCAGNGTTGPARSSSTSSPEERWLESSAVKCIVAHESGGDYGIIDYPYSGAFQFLDSTWTSVTGLPLPAADYSPAVQNAAAFKLYSEDGWSPWGTRYVCRV